MRRLLGFILALSASFACDQSYEEVGGYKIGCPHDFINDSGRRVFDSKITRYELKDKYIQKTLSPASINVYVVDGNIEGVMLDRSYADYYKMRKDKESILSDIKDTWGGEYEKNGYNYIIRNLKSEILDHVTVIDMWSHRERGAIHVWFDSKKIQSHLDLIQKQVEKGVVLYRTDCCFGCEPLEGEKYQIERNEMHREMPNKLVDDQVNTPSQDMIIRMYEKGLVDPKDLIEIEKLKRSTKFSIMQEHDF